MATRRMIALAVVDNDRFLDMPPSTQNLYFHLNVRADDDGFVGSPRRIARLVGANEDDINLLIAKDFVIPFESGVIVITHFNISNTLKKDRYHPTIYTRELALLRKMPNKAYILAEDEGTGTFLDTDGFQSGNISVPEDSIDKQNITKSGSSGDDEYTHVWNEIPSEELAEIEALYEDADVLISEVDEYVRTRHIIIEGSIRNYILAAAEKKSWQRKPTKDPLLMPRF